MPYPPVLPWPEPCVRTICSRAPVCSGEGPRWLMGVPIGCPDPCERTTSRALACSGVPAALPRLLEPAWLPEGGPSKRNGPGGGLPWWLASSCPRGGGLVAANR